MKVAHILRKLDPLEWSGTEMAMHRLLHGLRGHGVTPAVFCPRLRGRRAVRDPLVESGFQVRRFNAFVPVIGLSEARKRQLVAVGGNLMSLDLFPWLWREQDLSVIHAHTLGRLGGIALTVARKRQLPFVVTIHGGVLDLPPTVQRSFNSGQKEGWEWGKFFGLLFQSHRLFRDADAVLTCNAREAALLREQLPDKQIVVQAHGVPIEVYAQDCREVALEVFPTIRGREVILCLGRIDPIKNQGWLLEQAPRLFEKHPGSLLVLAGPCTDESYGRQIRKQIQHLGIDQRVLLTGGLPPNDPRTVGLLQQSRLLVLPSLSETFGLVILEAWAAGTMVVSVRASGPAALVEEGRNGWFFDLDQPETFHEAVDRTLADPARARAMAEEGRHVAQQYSVSALAGQLARLYARLVEEKQCITS